MSWDINRVILLGRLTNDVELKYTPSGTAVAKFGLAVGGKPKNDGANSVSFFNIVAWGKTAENCGNFLSKGKQVAIDGRLEQRSWTAQDGSRRSTIEVIADRVEFLGASGGGAAKSAAGPSGNAAAVNNSGEAASGGFEDNFYDNTNFDPTPIDPALSPDEQNPNDPNF
jgi:single-strand DNA-binding protein